jgi:hypothetical protein
MEAPKCRLCEKRHYGSCAEPVVASEPRARKSGKSVSPKKKSDVFGMKVVLDPAMGDGVKLALPVQGLDPTGDATLEDRIFNLERIVDELLSGKRKRSEYMREYMRERRK